MHVSPDGKGNGASIPDFLAREAQTSGFQDVAGYDFGGPGFNLTDSRPELVHGIHVTQAYFRLFGAPVALGRTFTEQEDSPNGGQVVVLSYGLWQRKFGGKPNIIGTALSIGNEPYTIVGVYSVQQRTQELGIRMALGADRNRIGRKRISWAHGA